ncbi:MAG TPA: hypothetical protein DCM28_13060 [Phycisphaerales bacterium]|nr:hypothetical protein [Phycisphaerales bacterium]HCD35052.1 hypothetical protein [Phycisphaerales bacterium]|tara:strand:+ start:1006 stop:1494 length:489 start_codon:yes stop_codon:yes gene_type:complete
MSGHTYDQSSLAKRFASRRAAKRKSPVMRLNLTSMIDVIFLLLVYFVVTANFATGEGVLTTNMPAKSGGEFAIDMPPVMPLRVYLYADDGTSYKIRVVGQTEQPKTFTELATLLKQTSQHMNADDPVVIQPVGDVKWEHVLGAFNAAVKAEFQNVQFGEQTQ